MKTQVYNRFFNQEIWLKVNTDNKELLDDFLLELKQSKKSEQTIYQYSRDIMGIFCYVYEHLGNEYILNLAKKDFRKFSLYLTDGCGVSNARHNRLLSSLRSLLDFAEENDDDYVYDINMAKKVKTLSKDPVRSIMFLSDIQVLKLMNELIKREEFQKATLLMLAYDSAGRKGELAQVEKHSFYDSNKNNTNIVVGKGGKQFPLIYFHHTKECANLWLEQRGFDHIELLWVVDLEGNRRPADKHNVYDWFVVMKNLLSEIEEEEVNFSVHSLRHTSLQNYSDGTHYVCREGEQSQGIPIEKLKLLANHSDISTTSGYLKDNSISELENLFGINIT